MVIELRDRSGGNICNTHLVGSKVLNHTIKMQKLRDIWRILNPHKDEFTYHRPQTNIHSSLDRIFASNDLQIIKSPIMPPVLRPRNLTRRFYTESQNPQPGILETKHINFTTWKFPNSN